MLTIHNSQLQALQMALSAGFIDYMMIFLRDESEEVFVDASDEELREFIEYGISRSAAHNLKDLYHVQQFILFMSWVGKDFDTDPDNPWAAKILSNPELSNSDKIGELEDYIMSEWEGAK